jgi:hypothetical protein
MRITAECSPYGTMLDLLLLEAEEMRSDQILLISRSERTNLYFVSRNRVQKVLQLQIDCTPDLLEHLNKTRATVKSTATEPNSVQVKMAQNRTGRCVSLTIQKAEPSCTRQDVDSTIKIPPVDLA